MADEHDIGGKSEKPPVLPPAPVKPASAARDEARPEETAVRQRGEAQVTDLRRRIDQVDDQLMKLLNSRSACAVEIGRIKRRIGMPVYQPDREKWILDRAERNNPGPLDSGAVRRVFERVIDESRRLERLAGEALETEEGGTGHERRATDDEQRTTNNG
jgi:chorismate mutase